MQSTNIIAYRSKGFFGIPIIGKDAAFAIKLDTGAANTIISIEKITGDLSDVQLSEIKSLILSKGITPKEFQSASGHPVNAYPTYMSDVTVGNYLFERFYYYVVVDRLYKDRKIALLGDDFINCCGFTRKPHGDIIISQFDFLSYRFDTSAFSTEEIMLII